MYRFVVYKNILDVLFHSNIFFLKEYIMSDSIEENNINDILAKIEKLQQTEQKLIEELDIYTSTNSGFVSTDPKIIDLLTKINNIAESRILMFNIISNNANIMQTGVSQSRVDLVNQLTLLDVVENQLNQASYREF